MFHQKKQLIYGKFFGIIFTVMKMDKEILFRALKLIENVTPLNTDCGLLCGGVCCRDNGEAGSGVWLLPGEEHVPHLWADTTATKTPVTKTELNMIYCRGMCERDKRPFLCRIFPLSPYYSEKKSCWSVRMDRRAAALCPLHGYGVRGLKPEFIDACREAVKLIASDEEGEKLLRVLEQEEGAFRFEL